MDWITLITLLILVGLAVGCWAWNERDEKHFNEMYKGGKFRASVKTKQDRVQVVGKLNKPIDDLKKE